MTGFFLREDELNKTMESAGLVPHCLDHSPALSEQDEQGSPRGGDQVELWVQIIRVVRSRGQVKRVRSRWRQEANLQARVRFGEGNQDQLQPSDCCLMGRSSSWNSPLQWRRKFLVCKDCLVFYKRWNFWEATGLRQWWGPSPMLWETWWWKCMSRMLDGKQCCICMFLFVFLITA